MSYFGRNIKKIRTAKKISQTGFADLFNLKRGSIGAYEEGRAEAKIDTVIEIAEFYKLSVDQLLRKELTINEIYHISEKSQKFEKSYKQISLDNSIPYVKEKDRIEFIQKFNNQTYLQGLQSIRLPNLKSASIAFEYTGSEMITNCVGIKHGDVIVAEPFDLGNLANDSIKPIFIIIEGDKFHIGRIFTDGEFISLKYDNPNYMDISINKVNIKVIWKANQLIINQFDKVPDLELRLQNIEKKIDKILNS